MIDARGGELVGRSRLHEPAPGDPLHVLVIDELAALIAYADPDTRRDAGRLLSELLTQGRALGVVVVALVQDPRKETVGQRGLFTQTVALRLRSAEETRMVLGDGMARGGAGASDQSRRPGHRVRRRRRRHRGPGPRALVERPAGPRGCRHPPRPGPRRGGCANPIASRWSWPRRFRSRPGRASRGPREPHGTRRRRLLLTARCHHDRVIRATRVVGFRVVRDPAGVAVDRRRRRRHRTQPPGRCGTSASAARWWQACAAAAGEWQVTAGWWAGAHREPLIESRSRTEPAWVAVTVGRSGRVLPGARQGVLRLR